MARLDDLPLWLRTSLKLYPWRRAHADTATPLAKPLASVRVALLTTAGLVPLGEPPFDEGVRGGDVSYRVIPASVDVATLGEFHRSDSFDHAGIARDRNLAFPLDRLRELAAAGRIGEVAPRHLSFMGSITAPGRLVKRTAPEALELLAQDRVDVLLLVPV